VQPQQAIINDGNEDNEENWKVGDKITIVNNNQYPACATIRAINGNKITVDKLPFTSVEYTQIPIIGSFLYLSPDDRTICACY
jgi:hypothetical protein